MSAWDDASADPSDKKNPYIKPDLDPFEKTKDGIRKAGADFLYEMQNLGKQVREEATAGVLKSMMAEVETVHADRLAAAGMGQERLHRQVPTDCAHLHAEVSEIFEAWRKGLTGPDLVLTEDGIRHVASVDMGPAKPVGTHAEAADVLIRLLDFCNRNNIDLHKQYRRVMDYNAGRDWTKEGKRS